MIFGQPFATALRKCARMLGYFALLNTRRCTVVKRLQPAGFGPGVNAVEDGGGGGATGGGGGGAGAGGGGGALAVEQGHGSDSQ